MKKIYIMILFILVFLLGFASKYQFADLPYVGPQDTICQMQKIIWLEKTDPELQKWINPEEKDEMSE